MHQWIYSLLARSTRPPLLVNRRCGNDRAEILGFLIKHKHNLPLLTLITVISQLSLSVYACDCLCLKLNIVIDEW